MDCGVAGEQNGAPIRLVITDVIIPRMDSNEMAESRLKR
jgi:hypothetical protein